MTRVLAQLICQETTFVSSVKTNPYPSGSPLSQVFGLPSNILYEALSNLQTLLKKGVVVVLSDSTLSTKFKTSGEMLSQHDSYLALEKRVRLRLFLAHFNEVAAKLEFKKLKESEGRDLQT